jgi:hypothetical protein
LCWIIDWWSIFISSLQAMNPYTPPTDSQPKPRIKRRPRPEDPVDAIGSVMLAILVFIMIMVGMLIKS